MERYGGSIMEQTIADRFRREHCDTCPAELCDKSLTDMANCAAILTYFNIKRNSITMLEIPHTLEECNSIQCIKCKFVKALNSSGPYTEICQLRRYLMTIHNSGK